MSFRVVRVVMAVLLFTAAGLQYNDPDPIQWTALYGAAGLVSIVHHRLPWGPVAAPAVLLAISLAWAGAIAGGVKGDIAAGELFGLMDANRPHLEEVRETIGLLIVAAWMAALAFRGRAKTKAASPQRPLKN